MKKPVIHPSAFVADNATVRGSVTLGANSSVFFGAVLRGDRAPITIGAGTNIQDNCVVHVDYDHPVTVGENVTVGHGAILHGCTVGDNTLIGMGAIVLNGAKVGSNCLIGAGALVPQNVEIPDGSLAFGSPAKIKGQLDEAAIAELRQAALAEYQQEGKDFVPLYKKMLHATSVTCVEDTAKIAGIDLTDKAFWRQGLQSLADEIDLFCQLVK